MSIITIFGASHGLGLSLAIKLHQDGHNLELIGRDFTLAKKYFSRESRDTMKVKFFEFDLLVDDLSILLNSLCSKPKCVFYMIGVGRLEHFAQTDDKYISDCFLLNSEIPAKVIRHYFCHLRGREDFFFSCTTSVAGHLSSPLFAVYAASKAALSRLIESLNIELIVAGSRNRITEFCPGYFDGSSFYGEETDISKLNDITDHLIESAFGKETLFIPNYDAVYKRVFDEYRNNETEFGISSYWYKIGKIPLKGTPK